MSKPNPLQQFLRMLARASLREMVDLKPAGVHLCAPWGGRRGAHTAARNARAARRARR